MKYLAFLVLLFSIVACQQNSVIQPSSPAPVAGPWTEITVTDSMIFHWQWRVIHRDSLWKVSGSVTPWSGTAHHYQDVWDDYTLHGKYLDDTSVFTNLIMIPIDSATGNELMVGPPFRHPDPLPFDTVGYDPRLYLLMWNDAWKAVCRFGIDPATGTVAAPEYICYMFKAYTNGIDTVIYKLSQEYPHGYNPATNMYESFTKEPWKIKYIKVD